MLNVLRAISLCAIAITLTAAAPAKPSFALLLTGGSASEKYRAYADAALIKALRARGFLGDRSSDPAGDLSVLGPAICASTGVQLLFGSTLAVEVQPDREVVQWAMAKIDVAGYDCVAGRSLGVTSSSGASFRWNWAVDQSVDAALKNITRGVI
jgi:hypothetical protein